MDGLLTTNFEDPGWGKLVAANIGAVIMPWMLFYQQSALAEKRTAELQRERLDTAVGTVVTQAVMSGMLVTIAALRGGVKRNIEEVVDILEPLEQVLGSPLAAQALLTLGVVGSSLVAGIVVTVCAAWSICEAADCPRSLELPPREARIFYSSHVAMCFIGFVVSVSPVSVIELNIYVELLNSIFM